MTYRPNLLSSTSITGDKVTNLEGENLGDIKDLMIDLDTGQIAYAVLSFGGFLGLGDKYFAMPWQALRLDAENKCFKLNVDKEKLKDAPGFDKDDWPNWSDSAYHDTIHEYYGYTPRRAA